MVAIDDQGLTELEQFRKSLPESDGKGHYWDSAIQGWRNNDGSLYDPQWQNKQVPNDPYFGNFDSGAAENLGSTQSQKPNFTPPAPSYSLSTPALGQFNVANPDMNGDGLDDSTGWAMGVVRDSGSPSGYSYNGTPVTTNGAPWQGPTQGSLLGPNFPQNPVPQTPTGPFTAPSNPWTYNAALAGANPLGQPDALADSFRDVVRQPEPLGQGYKPDVRFPETPMLGNPLMGGLKLYDRVTNPIVETASQLTPAAITAAKYAPGIGGAVNLGLGVAGKLGLDYSPEENAVKGIKQLGGSLGEAVQNPTNPLAFGEAQNEKFNERPTWQQIAGQVVYDPGNYVGGIGIAKKLGLIDDAGQFAPDAIKTGKTLKGLTGADEAIRTLGKADEFPAFAPDLARITKYPAGTIGIADNVAVPRLAGAADDLLDTSLNPIRSKIADALDNELKFRNSGEAEAIKTAKRAEQAAGFTQAQAGATSAETLANVSAGGKVGNFFDNTPGIKLPEADYNAALTDIVNSTEGFDKIQAVKALDKLQNGERLQPGEIKTLGKLYGPEVEAKIRQTNAGRIATVAELTDADLVKIAEQSKVDGRKVAVLEAQARRQHELADDLLKQSRMDPTNPRLKKAVDDARERGIRKANEADRIMADRAEKATANLPQRTEAGILQGERAGQLTARQAEQADKVALRNANKAAIKASDEQMVTRAKDVVAKLDMPDTNKSLLIDTIEAGAKKQRVLLDGMGEDGPSILRKIYAATTGEVTDSYTSQLLTQRAFIQNALESQGMSSAAAKKVGKLLQDADIRMRFGDNIPEWVTKSIGQSKFDFNEGGAIKGLADISQELKNTQFGIGDLAVFGQQGAKLAATNAPQFVAGLVNRILNMVHLGADTGLEGLSKSTAYQLDGLARKSVAITDLTTERTLVSRLGPVGRALDSKAIVPATKWLTDLQFDHILGKAREITYEGNLVLAKLVGEDITDPAVRLRAAEWANAASGAGKLAQQAGRKNAERAFLLSPSMRRAQIQQMGQVMKGLAGQQGLQGEIYAIATISSMAGALAAAKAINDRYGMDEFVWDPRKQGFGNITLPGGHVLNPFSQEQLVKAFARSLEVLGDGNLTEEDAAKIAKEWGKLGISSASPAIRPFLAQVGVGYDPGKGYAFGDLGEGKGFKGKLLDAAPIPPIGQQILRGDVGKVQTPLDIFGVGNYPEGQYQTLDRKVKADPAFGGRGYSDLSPSEKQAAQEKYGKLDPFGPEGIRSQEVTTQLTTQQAESDTRRREGELTPEQWRKDYSDRKSERFIRNDEIYHATNFKPGKDTILNGYYAAIGQAERPDGTVDWDKVDAYRAGLDAPANKHIDDNTGLVKIDTPVVRQFEADKQKIEDSGFFERTDANWNQIKDAIGLPDKTYEEWKDEQRKSLMDQLGITSEDVATAASVEKAIGKMPIEKAMDKLGSAWRDQWAIEHPEEAYAAMKYGYYSPKEEIRLWLASKFE